MSLFGKLSPSAQRSALAVVMLVILLASTAVAYWLQYTGSRPLDGEQWYLVTNAVGQPDGWMVTYRHDKKPFGLGGHRAEAKPATGQGPVLSWTKWQLDASGRKGRQASLTPVTTSGGGTEIVTEVDFDGREMTIRNTDLSSRQVLTDGTDQLAQFVPAGRIEPMVVQVANDKSSVSGLRMYQPPGGLEIRAPLGWIRQVLMHVEAFGLEYAEQVEREVSGRRVPLAVVSMTEGGSEGPASLVTRYYVAEDESIPLIEVTRGGKVVRTYTLVGPDAVREEYPDAIATLRRSLAIHRWDD